ncbi:MAG: hypothetical protein V7607_3990 [Solirubrobacteraceae bacterium]
MTTCAAILEAVGELLDAEPLITRCFGLDEANAALTAALDRELVTGVLVLA